MWSYFAVFVFNPSWWRVLWPLLLSASLWWTTYKQSSVITECLRLPHLQRMETFWQRIKINGSTRCSRLPVRMEELGALTGVLTPGCLLQLPYWRPCVQACKQTGWNIHVWRPCGPWFRLSAWGILADTEAAWMIFAMSDKHKGKCFTSWLGRTSDVSLLSAGVCPHLPQRDPGLQKFLLF